MSEHCQKLEVDDLIEKMVSSCYEMQKHMTLIEQVANTYGISSVDKYRVDCLRYGEQILKETEKTLHEILVEMLSPPTGLNINVTVPNEQVVDYSDMPPLELIDSIPKSSGSHCDTQYHTHGNDRKYRKRLRKRQNRRNT